MERRLKEQEEAILAQQKKIRENNEFMIEAYPVLVCFILTVPDGFAGDQYHRDMVDQILLFHIFQHGKNNIL